MVDHWWCWPRNKVSLGNSASSQTCFDQNPPPCQQLQSLADQTISDDSIVISISNLWDYRAWQLCELWWSREQPCALPRFRELLEIASADGKSLQIAQCSHWAQPSLLLGKFALVKFWSGTLVLARALRSLSGSGFEEEWGRKKGATCQEKREEQKRRWGPERQLGI